MNIHKIGQQGLKKVQIKKQLCGAKCPKQDFSSGTLQCHISSVVGAVSPSHACWLLLLLDENERHRPAAAAELRTTTRQWCSQLFEYASVCILSIIEALKIRAKSINGINYSDSAIHF